MVVTTSPRALGQVGSKCVVGGGDVGVLVSQYQS
jgi:hypothetical protein